MLHDIALYKFNIHIDIHMDKCLACNISATMRDRGVASMDHLQETTYCDLRVQWSRV